MDRAWVEQKDDGSEVYHGSRGAIFEGVRMKKGLRRGLQAKGKGVEREPYHYGERVDPCVNQLDKLLAEKSMANLRSYFHCLSVPAWQRRQEQIDLGLIQQHQSVRVEDEMDDVDR